MPTLAPGSCPLTLAPDPWLLLPARRRFTLYLLPINLPYGMVTALVAKAIIGEQP